MLHANLASLSGTKTAPYLVMFLTSNLGGWAGDYLITQRITSTAGGRKAVNTIGTAYLARQKQDSRLMELASARAAASSEICHLAVVQRHQAAWLLSNGHPRGFS